jgi:DNA polymerase-3 subunit delta
LLYILWGPDDYSLSQVIDGLKKEADAAAAFSSGVSTLDGQKSTPEQLRNACAAAPFLSGKRLVIIYGLLEKFEPKGKHGRPRKGSAERKEEDYKAFAAALANIPDSTIVALAEGPISGNNPLFKELSPTATLKSFPLLKDALLKTWIQRKIKELNAAASPQSIDLLAKLVGGNLWVLSNEIEKLALYAGCRQIEERDVKLMVSQTEQDDVFDMVDAIMGLKTETASRRLQTLLRRGAAPTYLLFMLCRQIRLIVRVRELKKQGASEAEMQNRLGIPSSFVIRKTAEQSSRYSLARLREVYEQLLLSDLWIKTGTYDGELAITILVSELSGAQKSAKTVVYPLVN